MTNQNELRDVLTDHISTIISNPEWDDGRVVTELRTILDRYDSPSSLYVPTESLLLLIEEYNHWCKSPRKDLIVGGELMEKIALLTFKSIKGHGSPKSYQSYAHEHDLVVSGTSDSWTTFIEFLGLNKTARTIVIEAKNRKTKVTSSPPQK
jgi:hypothetical protein